MENILDSISAKRDFISVGKFDVLEGVRLSACGDVFSDRFTKELRGLLNLYLLLEKQLVGS